MKRYGYLWEKFATVQNAERAIMLGTANKRRNHHVQRKLCYDTLDPDKRYQLDPEKVRRYAQKVVTMLESDWTHGEMRKKKICPPRGKERDIDSPCLTDHIIHWMVILTIQDALMRGMYAHTCGSIPNRGIESARKIVEKWAQEDGKAKYFVKLDIRKFYPNIDQEILKAKFRRLIKDERMLKVIDEIIASVPKGLPIGTYTSQWFANFYLQSLDHYITQGIYKTRRGKRIALVKHYTRYMDDMLLMGTSKADLKKAVRAVMRYCRKELHIGIKPAWEIQEIAECRYTEDGKRIIEKGKAPIDIVGYRFFKNRTEARAKVYLNARRVLKRADKTIKEQGYITLRQAQSLSSVLGWFTHADCQAWVRMACRTINTNFVRRVIAYAATNRIDRPAARVFCDRGRKAGDYRILYGC